MTWCYERLIRPVLFRFDPALMHRVFTRLGQFAALPPIRSCFRFLYRVEDDRLVQELHGIRFPNPVGLAAGFDKECELVPIMHATGFGFVEVGSITAEPYAGNKGKHMVRLPPDESMVIYYGLKSSGARNLQPRLARPAPLPVGVSVAKTNRRFDSEAAKLADWVEGVRLLGPYGDYLTINISCPNTHDPQNFNDPRLLRKLLEAIEREAVVPQKPVLLKVSPDITVERLNGILRVCDGYKWVTGFIVSNLIKDRSKVDLRSPKALHERHPGGLSGRPLQPYALRMIRHIRRQTRDRYLLVGCGGIFSAEDAYAYITAGASLVQLITGMIFKGPGVVKEINRGLLALLERDGHATIADAVGTDR